MLNEKFDRYSFILDQTAKKVKQFAQSSFTEKGFDITVDQWAVLKALYETEQLSQKDLARRCGKDQPTLTRIVDILLKKGLAERVIDETDRRSLYLHLTEEGKLKVASLSHIVAEIRMKAWEKLTEKDFEDFTRILNTIYNNLNV
ncbi:MarR family transcriptional regulator [Sphingobacterium sp. DR205]|uniref:MarR family winged helix-turn-helix transcriptional regulator n=1 Tax=Sphingobacterium sp. DR205 TaxID=2713573 RepID=UPI0013E4E41F|nr:MarR family transcriptional regulator [Sphingobacterium sp. DR205]QIH32427.1 MarR family transcriptional regulator [Sphingobacterium sp. DR205]